MALNRTERRRRIHYRIRKHVSGTAQRPRMVVFRSNKQIYVQVIDDEQGKTLAAAASNDKLLAAYLADIYRFAFVSAVRLFPDLTCAVLMRICFLNRLAVLITAFTGIGHKAFLGTGSLLCNGGGIAVDMLIGVIFRVSIAFAFPALIGGICIKGSRFTCPGIRFTFCKGAHRPLRKHK